MEQLIIISILIVAILLWLSKGGNRNEKFDCLSQCPYNKYYGNWNYSPFYTPLPVNEDSYRHYYSDLPCKYRWKV